MPTITEDDFFATPKKVITKADPITRPRPAQDDFFGEGGMDPNAQLPVGIPGAPPPKDAPLGIDEVRRRQLATAATHAEDGGYDDARSADHAANDALQDRIRASSAGQPGIDLPFLGDIPGVGNTVEGAFSGVQSGLLGAADEIADDPLMALATGGTSATIAGGDALADDLVSGVARDITGNDNVDINLPLTPGQIYEPNAPIYTDYDGTEVNLPGARKIGEGIADGAVAVGEGIADGVSAIGDGLSDFFDFGGLNGAGGAGGGGGAGGVGGGGIPAGATRARELGAGVMGGDALAPNAADRAAQAGALGATQDFATGPRAVDPLMAEFGKFMRQPEGPSKAQLLLDQASQGSMADVLSASRSARSRSAGDQARQAAVAQGEIAGMGVDNARNAALLRQQESQDFIGQQLKALEGAGGLATARDSNTLGALGVGGDLASQMRNAGVAERGDTLDFGAGMEQIAAGLEGDVIQAQPGLEAVRHDDQYELTPDQKLKLALIGGVGDVFSMFG